MFEITITETKTVKRLVQPEYGIICEKEVEREERFWTTRGPNEEKEPRTRIDKIYGHPPKIEKEVSVTTELLKQSVESLDLAAVIKAINNL